jgi:ferredoxin-nitrite reductase
MAQPVSGTSEARDFSAAQKEYLEGYLRAVSGSAAAGTSTGGKSSEPVPYSEKDSLGHKAQQAWLAAGKRLSKEEQIKFESNPLEAWNRIEELSKQDVLPRDADLFRFKYHGLFNVTPAQESMMCRLRFPGGAVTPAQIEAVAACAEEFGGGYADITTRANLQIREIPARHMADLLIRLNEAGITPRGAGSDNIRNVTGNPTAGIDAAELIDVLPLCRKMHHHILNNGELYGLPRKFNIAFDGGGSISSLEDTNDIGFRAVRVETQNATVGIPEGVYFRLALGGITGHKDFARDTGVLVKPEESIALAAAIVKVFIAHGDRGSRTKARLKYVLDRLGFEAFLGEVEKLLPEPLLRFPLEKCTFAPASDRMAHLGVQPQKQPGLCWVGARVPAGRLSVDQLRSLAAIARQYAGPSEPNGASLRLTVWQNFLIANVPGRLAAECADQLRALGLSTDPDPIAAGLVACTGAEGCKFGQAPTKKTSVAIDAHLRDAIAAGRLSLDQTVNIHLTGCPHSCAQHFIGDIGLLATTTEIDGEVRGAFHIFVGGGFQDQSRIAVQVLREVGVEEVPLVIESLLRVYQDQRVGSESFTDFTRRRTDAEIETLFSTPLVENSNLSLAS